MNRLKAVLFILLSCSSLHAQHPIVQHILTEIKLDSLVNFVEQLTGSKPVVVNGQSTTISSRQYQKPGNEIAFQFMKQELQRYGYAIDSFKFSSGGKNLFAIKTGYEYPDRWLMLGAHYDNLPLTTIAPGADDNASGCAAVLEAGRVLSNYDFPYSIVLALWDEEEPGLLGSTAQMHRIGSKGEKLAGYINLDMIAWDGNNDSVVDLHVKQINHSDALKNKAIYCNSVYDLQVTLNVVDPGFYYSDQFPFWENGHSAIAINENYLQDLNPHYHSASDVMSHFNMSYFLRCAKLGIATLAELALDMEEDYGIIEDAYDLVKIYPNPFHEQLTFRTITKNELIQKIVLVDYTGQQLFEREYNNKSVVLTDQDYLRNGVYLVTIFTSNGSYVRRIVKF